MNAKRGTIEQERPRHALVCRGRDCAALLALKQQN